MVDSVGVQRMNNTKTICKLLKALYGLRQAPSRSNLKNDLVLEGIRFESSPGDLPLRPEDV